MDYAEVDRYYREHPDCLNGMYVAEDSEGSPVLCQFTQDARDEPPTYLFVFDAIEPLAGTMRLLGIEKYVARKISRSKDLVAACRKADVRLHAHPEKGTFITFDANFRTTGEGPLPPKDFVLTKDQLEAMARLLLSIVERERKAVD